MYAVRIYSRDLRVPWGTRMGKENEKFERRIGKVWLTEDAEITDGNKIGRAHV